MISVYSAEEYPLITYTSDRVLLHWPMSGLCRPQKHGPKLGQSQSPSTANVALNAVTEQVRRQKVTSLDRVCIHDTSVDTPALRPHQQQHSRQLVAAYIPFSWMDASCRQETTTLPSEESAAAKGDSPGDVDEQRRAENARLAVVPPYWQHRRYESYASANIVRPPAIILEDHTEDLEPNCQTPLWAKEVSLQDYVVVSGNIPSVGDYVVWNCTIQTLDVGPSSSTPSI